MPKKWDVIIVGAGPAGATLGYELGKLGVRTLILEKFKLPRYKVCGGGLNIKTVDRIGFDIRPVVENTVIGAHVTFRMGDPFTKTCDRPLTLTTSRETFDHFLVQKAQEAGCVLHEQERVERVEIQPDRVTVCSSSTSYSGEFVVGADGANSIVARSAGLLPDPFLGVGIESEVQVSTTDLETWKEFVQIDLGSVKNGYGWIFPKHDHLSIGVWGPLASFRELKLYYQRFTDKWKSRMGSWRVIRKKGHLIPIRRKGHAIQGDRALLIGDAAGLVEPLSGEGIYYAVRSAQMASGAIGDYLSSPQNNPLSIYETTVDSTLMMDIQRAKAYQVLFNRYPRFFFGVLKRRERLWRAACALIRGEETFTDIGRTWGPFEFVLNKLDW